MHFWQKCGFFQTMNCLTSVLLYYPMMLQKSMPVCLFCLLRAQYFPGNASVCNLSENWGHFFKQRNTLKISQQKLKKNIPWLLCIYVYFLLANVHNEISWLPMKRNFCCLHSDLGRGFEFVALAAQQNVLFCEKHVVLSQNRCVCCSPD